MKKIILITIFILLLIPIVYAITYGTRSNSCTGCFDYYTRKADNATFADDAKNAYTTDWGNLTGVPAGFADNVDDTGSVTAGANLNVSSSNFTGLQNFTGTIYLDALTGDLCLKLDTNKGITTTTCASGGEGTNYSDIAGNLINASVFFAVKNITINQTINLTDKEGRFAGAVYTFGQQANYSISLDDYIYRIDISNNTPFSSIQNFPALSNMQLSNISNDSLRRADNETAGAWNITNLGGKINIWQKIQDWVFGFGRGNSSQNISTSNTTVIAVYGDFYINGTLNGTGDITLKDKINISGASGDVKSSGILDFSIVRMLGRLLQVEADAAKIANMTANFYSNFGTASANYANNTNSLNLNKNGTNIAHVNINASINVSIGDCVQHRNSTNEIVFSRCWNGSNMIERNLITGTNVST